MSAEYLGGCEKLCEAFDLKVDCCGSCHEDANEYGYSLCDVSVEGGYYEVCCSVATEYENKFPPEGEQA